MGETVNAESEILFVYNADGTLLARLADAVHKIARPQTYPCSLCALSHGALAIRAEWRRLLASLPLPARTLHRDESAQAFPGQGFAWPAVLLRQGAILRELVPAAELDACADLAMLGARLRDRLAEQGAAAPAGGQAAG